MNNILKEYIQNVHVGLENISVERKKTLLKVSNYILTNYQKNKKSNLMFVCTHNSRRSQLAQVWAYVGYKYYKVKNINVYSGGTKITVFNLCAINALKRSGLKVKKVKDDFLIRTSEKDSGLKCYSKKYNSKRNIKKNFIAIMTCSYVNETCPIVEGSNCKVFLPYIDPKTSDGTEDESRIYDRTCLNIAQEMFFIIRNSRDVFI